MPDLESVFAALDPMPPARTPTSSSAVAEEAFRSLQSRRREDATLVARQLGGYSGARSVQRWPSKVGIRLAVVAALVVVSACVVTVIALSGNSRHPASSAHAALAAQIDEFAASYAAQSGDSHPGTVTWVATTLGPANAVLWNHGSESDGATPVYALEITAGSGKFQLNVPLTPAQAAQEQYATGPVLDVLVDQASGEVWAVGFSKSPPPSLASLGVPEVDPLAGVHLTGHHRWENFTGRP